MCNGGVTYECVDARNDLEDLRCCGADAFERSEVGNDVRHVGVETNVALADRLWLATGTTAEITASRYLDDVIADLPVVDGYPIIDDSLRLPRLPIFVTGRLTTSILGPAAGNLWGAQRAAQRIARQVAATTT